jgi:hypothetical protein
MLKPKTEEDMSAGAFMFMLFFLFLFLASAIRGAYAFFKDFINLF